LLRFAAESSFFFIRQARVLQLEDDRLRAEEREAFAVQELDRERGNERAAFENISALQGELEAERRKVGELLSREEARKLDFESKMSEAESRRLALHEEVAPKNPLYLILQLRRMQEATRKRTQRDEEYCRRHESLLSRFEELKGTSDSLKNALDVAPGPFDPSAFHFQRYEDREWGFAAV
jgi:hypothetical protein